MKVLATMLQGVAAALLTVLSACSVLGPSTAVPPAFHAIDNSGWPAGLPHAGMHRAGAGGALRTLIVDPPLGGPGLDTRRILYARESYRVEYFARHEWVDTPAHMLGPLAVQALRESGAWVAVVLAPNAAVGDVRLSLQIVQLQHNFQRRPSLVQFALRASLSDATTRRVLASRDIAVTQQADAETPQAGVVAANFAVRQALIELAAFATTAAVP